MVVVVTVVLHEGVVVVAKPHNTHQTETEILETTETGEITETVTKIIIITGITEETRITDSY